MLWVNVIKLKFYPDELDTRPAFIVFVIDKIHYLHYGLILFIISGSVAVLISLLTCPIPEDHVSLHFIFNVNVWYWFYV